MRLVQNLGQVKGKKRVAEKQFPHRPGPPGPGQETKDLAPKGRSSEIAAKAVGVGKTTVDSAIILRQFALKEFRHML